MSRDFEELLLEQKRWASTGKLRDLYYREKQLQKLYDRIHSGESEIAEALEADFHKPELESFMTETGFLLAEIRHTLKHLRTWAAPRKVRGSIMQFGASSRIIAEPYGSVLVIAPWNYPVQLALAPLVAAVAAGNTVVLKPSELTPHTSSLLARIVAEVFEPNHVTVIEGGVEVSTELLTAPFDYIFFTGSTAVGRIVAEAAAKRLVPVTLELGGKSPVIVDRSASIDLAARRIAWGKFINAGQTCVAPDYILVERSVKTELVRALEREMKMLYGDVMSLHSAYASVINDRHFNRLSAFLRDGEVLSGGRTDPSRRRIEPTLLDEPSWESSVMQEEIFGPILPILAYDHLDEAIAAVNARPKPLALYCFTESKAVQERVLNEISFGGGCVNDTLMHLSSPYLPFGGVGESGMGSYHGEFGFHTFSHHKSVMTMTTRFDLPIRYGLTDRARSWLKRLMR